MTDFGLAFVVATIMVMVLWTVYPQLKKGLARIRKRLARK